MRQGLQILLAALVIAALGYAGYRVLFAEEEGARLEVVEARGDVVRSAPGGSQPLVAGDRLAVDDAVQVGPGSRAVLGVGEGTRLELEAESAVRVLAVEEGGIRVELEQGRVKARVRAGSTPLGLSSRGRAIYARDAELTAAVDGEGALAVDAERGAVRVEGVGVDATEVQAGQRLVAMPGREAAIGAIPTELLLEVGWPEVGRTRQKDVLVEGRTGAYAEVSVGQGDAWTTVRAGPDGSFRAQVPLEEGPNQLTVRARDALGNTREEEGAVLRDSTAPPITGSEVQWGP